MALLNPIVVSIYKNPVNPLNPILVNVVKGTISPTLRTISYGGSTSLATSALQLAQAAYNEANTLSYIPGANNDVLYVEDHKLSTNNYFNYDPDTEILHVNTVDATIDAGTF